MSKITPFCLGATLLAVATPAALAEDTQNIPFSCVDSGDKVQLMVPPDTSTEPEVFLWEKSIFPNASALCNQTAKNWTTALRYHEAEEEYFYLRIAENAGVDNLCLASIDSECSRILFELAPGQIQPVEAYLKNKYSVASATEERGYERGSYHVRNPFWFWFRR
ncbi:MAG: hypothetical protein F6K47_22440 [Symploca sp. SIO2E6]|nr:hypothetical protein [Symploca sp. SIO2E6]